MVVGYPGDLGDGAEDTCGGLGVDHGHGLDFGVLFDFGLYSLRRYGMTPFVLYFVDGDTAPFGYLGETVTEIAVDGHDDGVACFQGVDQGRFHSSRTGAGDGQRKAVGRLKHLTQHLPDVVHNAQEVGVQMPEQGCGHGLEHPRVDVAGAGPQ